MIKNNHTNDNSTSSVINNRLLDLQHINLQLAALGQPTCDIDTDQIYLKIADGLLQNYCQHRRLLASYRCPADQRIQDFVNCYLKEHGVEATINLPGETFTLHRKGLARELSLPVNSNRFRSRYVESHRVLQGVLHNPVSDRRTTKGVFHIVAGGPTVPMDKREVPVATFAALFQAALQPPDELLSLPLTSEQKDPAKVWVSLLMRPVVQAGIAGIAAEKRLETRFFAPGGLVSNLDFVETIFGNVGDPFLPENDAALDIDHWTGHTGCVLLAPHLTKLRKCDVGLPHFDQATARQRSEGMCWTNEDELYNDGQAFKIVCRDLRGVIVTIIADNYFGYSKKEIKTQISFSANLYGGCEEEHAGGALSFARFSLGQNYIPHGADPKLNYCYAKLCKQMHGHIQTQATGYAIDQQYANIIYIPEDAHIDLQQRCVHWQHQGQAQKLKILAGNTYIYPSGFRVNMERYPNAPSWRLVGTLAEGTFIHKPSTVSGGGKSEISKSISGAIISGPLYVGNIDEDFDFVDRIFSYDFASRFRDDHTEEADDRNILSNERSLGSVIKLLTPSVEQYNDEYNDWLASIPQHILALVFMIKRFYKKQWGVNWRDHFSVDLVNGYPGHELKYEGRRLVASYLRVGFDADDSWRIFKVRQDFVASEKIQLEDDITSSVVYPKNKIIGLQTINDSPSVKLVENCEAALFQRPDEAIHRGVDLQTESDLASGDNFISNFQPLSSNQAVELIEDIIEFEKYSAPMRKLIRTAAKQDNNHYFVSSAHARLVDGKPSPNVRYLQTRPDLVNPKARYIAEITTRLARGLNMDQAVNFAVDAVIPGRRNNPPERNKGIRALSVYNPIHYQQLPELFMDFICSVTGKSPSTTGAGSEGALTKGPFNALSTTADLNTALVSFILCGHDGFTTSAGHIGAHRRIDHDISFLIPELWCRLTPAEKNPDAMINKGYLEKLDDFEYAGNTVYASRLGYRITERFVHSIFGKIFDNPTAVLDEAMLRPESQDLQAFADGVDNIYQTQKRVALGYFEDGTIEDASPPIQALLHIMAHGHFQNKQIDDPVIRSMFTLDYLLKSDWYHKRLLTKKQRNEQRWKDHHQYLQTKLTEDSCELGSVHRQELLRRIEVAQTKLKELANPNYLDKLQGTLGADWVYQA